jgi:ABC-type transport system involved in cytochrome c biogenesis permease subunit
LFGDRGNDREESEECAPFDTFGDGMVVFPALISRIRILTILETRTLGVTAIASAIAITRIEIGRERCKSSVHSYL